MNVTIFITLMRHLHNGCYPNDICCLLFINLTLFILDTGKQVLWQTVHALIEDPDEIPIKGMLCLQR